jgi:DNA-binding transcriptional LysR family regulator
MSIDRFRYFFKVARVGSVREAAAVLHVAPSAISRQIAKLEMEFGADLIEPNGRGIRLTHAGQILAGRVGDMVDALEQARSQIDDLHGLRRGHVRIWTVEGSVGDPVMPTLALFHKRYPAVSYDLTVASTDRIVTALLDDDADLGVVFNPPDLPELAAIGQGADSIDGILPPRHPALRLRRLSLRELVTYPLALPDPTFGLRHLIDAAAKSCDVKLKPILTTNSIETLRAFVRSGAGVTVLPRFAIAGDIKRNTLRAVPLSDRKLQVACTMVLTRRARQLPLAATQLAEHLLQTMKGRGK